jgi:hypothetical protein
MFGHTATNGFPVVSPHDAYELHDVFLANRSPHVVDGFKLDRIRLDASLGDHEGQKLQGEYLVLAKCE